MQCSWCGGCCDVQATSAWQADLLRMRVCDGVMRVAQSLVRCFVAWQHLVSGTCQPGAAAVRLCSWQQSNVYLQAGADDGVGVLDSRCAAARLDDLLFGTWWDSGTSPGSMQSVLLVEFQAAVK